MMVYYAMQLNNCCSSLSLLLMLLSPSATQFSLALIAISEAEQTYGLSNKMEINSKSSQPNHTGLHYICNFSIIRVRCVFSHMLVVVDVFCIATHHILHMLNMLLHMYVLYYAHCAHSTCNYVDMCVCNGLPYQTN